MRRVLPLLLGLLVVLGALGGLAACQDTTNDPEATIRTIESRIFAPCCWNQTLDSHHSPLADELRAEIRRRVEAGDSQAAIENDLAARYTDRIRAVPGDVSSSSLGVPFAVTGALAVVLLVVIALRLRGRAGAGAGVAAAGAGAAGAVALSPADERLNDQLDDELRDLD